jgi:hypothetical protein
MANWGTRLSKDELSVLAYIIAHARKRGLQANDHIQFWDDATDTFDRITDFNQQADQVEFDQHQELMDRYFGDEDRARQLSIAVLQAITVLKDTPHPTPSS